MASEKYIRKVVKNGRNSYYLNIPREIVRALKLKERQKLIIGQQGKRIIISDWTK
ncbi:MAG TPA: AbrB/MazE/SpoVT family DNA-binding domain-containing protein [bacterium]|nr:AbrB/MazE/SpoVT family DNA-binding domain-containing protein [bacterium]HPN81028.1 AbrB/MazE/SpoVT family DNA-binding domain-containing protein [bacterium]HPW39311.1 AbrB/MazE/SpoVT family DNA-binding domain-containing protein [bacterium]